MADLHAVPNLVLLNDVLSPESRTYFKNLNETSVAAHTIVHEVLQDDTWTRAYSNRTHDFIANMPHYVLRRNFSAHRSTDAVLARQQTGTPWGVLHLIATEDNDTDMCKKIAVANRIRLHGSEMQDQNDNDLGQNWHCFLVSMLVDIFHE